MLTKPFEPQASSDVSVLELFDGITDVRASAGDNFPGGEDFVTVREALATDPLSLARAFKQEDADDAVDVIRVVPKRGLEPRPS